MTCRGNLRPPPQRNPQRPGLPGEEVASKVLGQAGRSGCWSQQLQGPCLGSGTPCSRWGLPEVGGHRVTSPRGAGSQSRCGWWRENPQPPAQGLWLPGFLACPLGPQSCLLGVPLRPRETGEKAGGG